MENIAQLDQGATQHLSSPELYISVKLSTRPFRSGASPGVLTVYGQLRFYSFVYHKGKKKGNH